MSGIDLPSPLLALAECGGHLRRMHLARRFSWTIGAASLAAGAGVAVISGDGGSDMLRGFLFEDVLPAFARLFYSGLPFCS